MNSNTNMYSNDLNKLNKMLMNKMHYMVHNTQYQYLELICYYLLYKSIDKALPVSLESGRNPGTVI